MLVGAHVTGSAYTENVDDESHSLVTNADTIHAYRLPLYPGTNPSASILSPSLHHPKVIEYRNYSVVSFVASFMIVRL